MSDKEKILIDKFLKKYYDDLEIVTIMENTYITLGQKNSNQKVFLYHAVSDTIFANNGRILDPIIKMFNTDYEETKNYIKEWVFKKYNIKSKLLVGLDLKNKTI